MPFWTPEGIYVDEQGNPIAPPPGSVPPVSPLVTGPAPLAVPPAPTQQVAQVPGGPGLAGAGYSASYSGTPQSARDLAVKGFAGDQAREQEKARQGFEAQAAPMAARTQQRADVVGTEEELAGAPSLSAATAGQMDAQRRMELYQAELMNRFAEDEKMAMAASQTIVQKARAEYTAEVREFQALEVNPGALWGAMGEGGRAQSLASVFVHNFLGARGIPTTAMDTLNRAIDRSIEAQIQNINVKGKAVDFFGQLYGMVRDESASDAEARQRLRGFYLAQADKLVAAELSKYDAPLAQAKLAEARMMIMAQGDKDLLALDNVWQERAQVGAQQWLSMRQSELAASMEARRIAEDARQFDKRLALDAAKLGPQFNEGLVYMDVDPTSPTFGTPQGMIIEGMTEAETAQVREAGSAAMTAMSKLKALRDEVASHDPQYGADFMSQLFTSEDEKRIAALREDIGFALARVMQGPGVLTEQDVQRAMKLVPLDTITTWGQVDQVINDSLLRVKEQYDIATAGKVRQFRGNEQMMAGTVRGLTAPSEGARHKTEGQGWGQGIQKSPVDLAIDESNKPLADHAEWLEIASGHAVTSGDAAEIQKVLNHIDQIEKGVYVGESGEGIDSYGGPELLKALKEDLTAALGGPSQFEKEREAAKKTEGVEVKRAQELLK